MNQTQDAQSASWPLRLLQVNAIAGTGGAARIASDLHHGCLQRGYPSWMAVGYPSPQEQTVLWLDSDRQRHPWSRFWRAVSQSFTPWRSQFPAIERLQNLLTYWIGRPNYWLAERLGHEDMDFPATQSLLQLPPHAPTLIHCHNLHGGYFDLRYLPQFSQQLPLIITLHDAWLLTGHCAHFLSCDRWRTGCGHCPDLSLYPAIRSDGTAYNWQRKQQIYRQSRLYLATPCQWLMDQVEQSMVMVGVVEGRVIPNGVDLTVFHPGDRASARAQLGIDPTAQVILFVASGIRQNSWKDYETMRSAIAQVAQRGTASDAPILFLALGETNPPERIGSAEIQFVPFQTDPREIATYYQAADLYLHAAKADTFPTTILEALACGLPVIATAICGIPEQVTAGETGFLVPLGDASAMADRIVQVLDDLEMRSRLGATAAEIARQRFNLDRMVGNYIDWYHEILTNQTVL